MTEASLTLRELFQADPKDLSRVEPGLDVYGAAQNAREEIAKEAHTIRWPWLRKIVAEQSEELLNLNVLDVLVHSWKKYMQIEKYADPANYAPGQRILEPLAEHIVKSEHHPYVQILLKEHDVGRIKFDLELSLRIEGFVLEIHDGRIWGNPDGLRKRRRVAVSRGGYAREARIEACTISRTHFSRRWHSAPQIRPQRRQIRRSGESCYFALSSSAVVPHGLVSVFCHPACNSHMRANVEMKTWPAFPIPHILR
jgi:hypothetical protein